MSTKNTRMSGPTVLTNAAVTKYTTPAGTVAVIQHIHVSNPSASPVTFTMSIGSDAAATRIYDGYTIGAGQVLDTFAKYVLQPAEIVQAFGGTTNILTFTLDGQELTAG
jgi:hypothetical protein